MELMGLLPPLGILPLRLCTLYPMRLLPLNPELHGEPPPLHQLSLLGGAGIHHHAEPRSGESALQGKCLRGGWEALGSPRPAPPFTVKEK